MAKKRRHGSFGNAPEQHRERYLANMDRLGMLVVRGRAYMDAGNCQYALLYANKALRAVTIMEENGTPGWATTIERDRRMVEKLISDFSQHCVKR